AFPTQTGGIGTGGDSSPVNMPGRRSSAASVRGPRSSYGTPARAHCPGPPPDPTPSTSRPPDTYWSVATCLAVQASGRIAGTRTLAPTVIRDVTAAAVASAIVTSRVGAARWSPCHTPSSPASSACRAASRRSMPLLTEGRMTPMVKSFMSSTVQPRPELRSSGADHAGTGWNANPWDGSDSGRDRGCAPAGGRLDRLGAVRLSPFPGASSREAPGCSVGVLLVVRGDVDLAAVGDDHLDAAVLDRLPHDRALRPQHVPELLDGLQLRAGLLVLRLLGRVLLLGLLHGGHRLAHLGRRLRLLQGDGEVLEEGGAALLAQELAHVLGDLRLPLLLGLRVEVGEVAPGELLAGRVQRPVERLGHVHAEQPAPPLVR